MRDRIINLAAFTALSLMWLAFGAALIINSSLLDTTWQVFRDLPPVGQLLIGLAALPVALGLWIWQTSWPVLIRLLLVIGLAWVSVYTFFPKKGNNLGLQSRSPENASF